MRIAICSCVHGRPKTAEKFLDSLYRMAYNAYIDNITVEAHIAVTPGDKFFKIAERHPASHLVNTYEYSNEHLGEKWNYALSKCYKSDYIMITGSDDLYSGNYLNACLPHLKNGIEYMGLLDMYFHDTIGEKMYYFGGYNSDRKGDTNGAGRIVSTKIAGAYHYRFWNSLAQKGLDAQLTTKMKGHNPKSRAFKMEELGVCAIDIKTAGNIWRATDYPVTEEDKNKVYDLLNS